MTIQLSQIYKNNIYKDDMYVTISKDSEIADLLYLKFYSNINSITVELLQNASKEVIRKILLMEHIDKIIYTNASGEKEELNANRKLIVKMNSQPNENLISDDTIIKFQQVLGVANNTIIVQNINILSDELLNLVEKNDAEYIRIMNYGKSKYTILQIRNMKEKIQDYVHIAKQGNTKTEQFIELYTALYNNMFVDYVGAADGNLCDLIYERTTMDGFAEILQKILDELKIENKIITGKLSNGSVHYWNQVKLDYIWYNVDLALDVKRKEDTDGIKYCLKCDKEFYEDHIALSRNIEICNQNSAYFLVKEIEEKEGVIVRLFKKIVKLVSRKKVKRLNTGRNY